MVVPFRVRYLTNSGALKKICTDCSSRNLPILIKLDLDKLTEPTGKNVCFIISELNQVKLFDCNYRTLNAEAYYHLELLFFTVLAFPNASSTGLDCMIQNYIHQN